jgi:uncharacterized membrane protein YgcG
MAQAVAQAAREVVRETLAMAREVRVAIVAMVVALEIMVSYWSFLKPPSTNLTEIPQGGSNNGGGHGSSGGSGSNNGGGTSLGLSPDAHEQSKTNIVSRQRRWWLG